MAHQLRELTALPEVLSSIPSNHMASHNHLQWDPIQCTHINKKIKEKKLATFLCDFLGNNSII